ncbi:MAG: IclR family transcriptional regulator [Paracoccus sp. (in: a-proteobacteria)]|uniref:IclR family transcriptional regulator n=1 Tax=Paracoccus sp. TaxID=267 RepID=UPI0026E0D64E|nr:IclR family transcriptional regulator [Paracoccus sp. (in: a-proteobacteria)]MDO5621625.1 IclR family transcriptional regulator [Paracoccus sp. (in: a-proteobacteria)]
MSSSLERGLSVLDLLSAHPEGLAVGQVAQTLDLPASGTHRLLNQLVEYGYVHQDGTRSAYTLGMKLPALGLSYLAQAGITDIAQPVLDRLAATSQQLVRLSVIDGGNLVWVAVAQGATTGLRYDPGREQGATAHLASSASGLAWLSTLSDDQALEKVARQGFAQASSGQGAPSGATEFLARLAQTRAQGWSVTVNSFIPGMAAMAAPVRMADGRTLGALSIAGPAILLDETRMTELAPALLAAADEMAVAARGSAFFRQQMGQAAV